MPITTKQYLDYQGLSTYNSLLKEYIDSANTLGVKSVVWDSKAEKIRFYKIKDVTEATIEANKEYQVAEVAISSAAVNELNKRVGILDALNSYQSASNLTTILNVLTADDTVAGSVANLLKNAIEALDVADFALASKSSDDIITIKGIKEVDGKIAASEDITKDVTFAKVAATGKAGDVSVAAATGTSAGGNTWSVADGTAQSTVETLASDIADADAAIAALSTSSVVTVEKLATAEEGYVASYVIKQNNTPVGEKINIPKDWLLKNVTIKTCQEIDKPEAGYEVGDRYFDFEFNVKDGIKETTTHTYLKVEEMYDAYTSGSGVGDTVVVTVDNANNKISADITDGTIARAKINAAFEKNIADVEATHAAAAEGSGAKYKTVAEEINDKVVTLNAEKDQSANAEATYAANTGLNLHIKEEDGKITEFSGSIDTVTEAQINSLFGK